MIHIGALIRAELTRQQITVTNLAAELGIQRPNCYRILRNSSIDTDTLLRISQILKHDFFAEYTQAVVPGWERR